MNSHVNVDGRRLILSFNYRFGNPFKLRDRKTGNDDIQNRIKGGGGRPGTVYFTFPTQTQLRCL